MNTLNVRCNEPIIAATVAAVFGAIAVISAVSPEFAAIINTLFTLAALLGGIALLGLIVWFFELYPTRDRSLPEPRNAGLPALTLARAYQGGDSG